MMMPTWMLSSGLLSTGIIRPMAGSICEMWLTSRKKPESRKPNTTTMWALRHARSESSWVNHATTSIVS